MHQLFVRQVVYNKLQLSQIAQFLNSFIPAKQLLLWFYPRCLDYLQHFTLWAGCPVFRAAKRFPWRKRIVSRPSNTRWLANRNRSLRVSHSFQCDPFSVVVPSPYLHLLFFGPQPPQTPKCLLSAAHRSPSNTFRTMKILLQFLCTPAPIPAAHPSSLEFGNPCLPHLFTFTL